MKKAFKIKIISNGIIVRETLFTEQVEGGKVATYGKEGKIERFYHSLEEFQIEINKELQKNMSANYKSDEFTLKYHLS